mgnify:CR=1 FL=1
MLCSMCQHGVTTAIDGKPTGKTWTCLNCGETHCRHFLWRCPTCKASSKMSRGALGWDCTDEYIQRGDEVVVGKIFDLLDANGDRLGARFYCTLAAWPGSPAAKILADKARDEKEDPCEPT